MATRKKTTRKTTKKSGAKKKATKKKVAKKRRSSGATSESSPARTKRGTKKSTAKKTKKKTRKKARKKASKKTAKKRKKTAAERRADKARRPQRRKPETGGRGAKKEILEFFGSEDVSSLSPAELKERKLTFLRAYANRGIVRDGCVAASISWGTYTRWRDKDEPFNEACEHAEMLAADRLEGEAYRRAQDGYEKPVIYQGEITDTYTEYSDSLMQTLLKGAKQKKYRERSETKHSGSVGRPMTLDAESKESVVSSILGMIENKPDPD